MGIDTFRNFHANHLQIHFDRASFGNEATVGNMFQILSNYNAAFASTALKKIYNMIELALKWWQIGGQIIEILKTERNK